MRHRAPDSQPAQSHNCYRPTGANARPSGFLLAAGTGLLHGRHTLRWRARGACDAPWEPDPRRCQSRPDQASPDTAPAHDHAAARAVVALCRPGASRIAGRARPDTGGRPIGGRRTEFTGAVRARALCPQTQGTRLSAATPLETAGTDAEGRDSRRHTRLIGVMANAAMQAVAGNLPRLSPVRSGLRSGSPPSHDVGPAPRARGRAAYRSSAPYDEAHADRRHPRGRNPRGGAGW